MFCVFHHISGHLPRQIKFWSILIKSWDWVSPPPIGTKSQVLPNFFLKAPLKLLTLAWSSLSQKYKTDYFTEGALLSNST